MQICGLEDMFSIEVRGFARAINIMPHNLKLCN